MERAIRKLKSVKEKRSESEKEVPYLFVRLFIQGRWLEYSCEKVKVTGHMIRTRARARHRLHVIHACIEDIKESKEQGKRGRKGVQGERRTREQSAVMRIKKKVSGDPSRIPSSWKGEKSKANPLSKKRVTSHTLKALIYKIAGTHPGGPPPIGAREMKHLADLAKIWGKDSEKYLSFAYAQWKIIRAKYNINRHIPDIRSIYTFRDQIVLLTSEWESGPTEPEHEEGW